MRDDSVGWGAAERKEIANHLENSTMTPIMRSQVPQSPPKPQARPHDLGLQRTR
jgi:hypothetical protein